jgi:hypothetical protein
MRSENKKVYAFILNTIDILITEKLKDKAFLVTDRGGP